MNDENINIIINDINNSRYNTFHIISINQISSTNIHKLKTIAIDKRPQIKHLIEFPYAFTCDDLTFTLMNDASDTINNILHLLSEGARFNLIYGNHVSIANFVKTSVATF